VNRKILSITVVCIILGIILAVQYRSVYNNTYLEGIEGKRLEDIKTQLLMEKQKNDDLRLRIEELETQKEELEGAYSNTTSVEKTLKKELDYSRMIAGLTDVKGAGIVVTLDNSVGLVADSDILNIVNELRASGAQAISVNGQRIVAVSEIREAGRYIVINGNKLMPPYYIKAIADPVSLKNALNLVGGIAENFQEMYNIKYSIEMVDEIVIPKVDSSIIKTNYLEPMKNK
jgi:uncharacterized protein YlxW (UPF0749 family)